MNFIKMTSFSFFSQFVIFSKIPKKVHYSGIVMVLSSIEFMDDKDKFNKLIKSYFDDTSKQLMQVFELMASQLRGKVEERGNRSFHHGETHNTINFE